MRRTEKQTTGNKKPWRRVIAIAVMIAVVVAGLSLTVFAQNSYLITDGDFVTVHRSYSTDPDVVLDEAGIELSEEDTYTTTYRTGVSRIDIQRMQMVTVINAGEKSVIGTYGETVKSLLTKMGIVPGTGDILSCEEDTPTYNGMVIELKHKEIQQAEYDKTFPFDTKYYEDPELAPGEEITLIEGVNGVIHYTAQLVYENGVKVSQEVIDEETTTKMVTRLVVRGPEREINDQPDEPDHRNESFEDPMNNGEHAISGGTITTVSGTMEVTKKPLTLTAESASKTYDGKALINRNVRATALASKDHVLNVEYEVTNSDGNVIKNGAVNVGTYTKRITTVTIKEGSKDVTSNYAITKVDGKLTITAGTTTKNNSSQPKTGDDRHVGLWISILVASVVLLALIVYVLIVRGKAGKSPKAPKAPKSQKKANRKP